MKRHQVLTGSANPGKYCYAVGSVKDFVFWIYGSGCDLIISDTKHEPIQIISSNKGVISAVDCCDYTGRIVVAYRSSLAVYVPCVKVISNVDDKLITWNLESTHVPSKLSDSIDMVSWDDVGEKVIMCAAHIYLWKYSLASSPSSENDSVLSIGEWSLLWRSAMKEYPSQLTLSPGHSYNCFFATIGKNDKRMKVWYKRFYSNESMPELIPKIDFSFIYLQHPDEVYSFEWRRNMFLNRHEVFANVLVSSCKDQICRIWCESVEPQSSKMHYLYMPQSSTTQDSKGSSNPLYYNKDCDKYDRKFYLCATINPHSDIPLLSTIVSKNKTNKDDNSIFTVHFLNNKYFQAKVQKSR